MIGALGWSVVGAQRLNPAGDTCWALHNPTKPFANHHHPYPVGGTLLFVLTYTALATRNEKRWFGPFPYSGGSPTPVVS
ncbi:hypothetical protein [Absidia glauca]|uniref:Uncharacterized protein n=1 Tax=Absidia glauca TaxID=4829 RepID=A0A168QH76_ABSGL|nr:hypothetical protein [Absidia glauca]